MENDIPGLLGGRSARLSSQIARSNLVNLYVIEHCCRISEDEIDSSGNKRVHIVLPPVIGEERVLIAEKSAMFKDGPVRSNSNGDRLPSWTCGVLKRQIVRFETFAIDLDRLTEECALSRARVLCCIDDNCRGVAARPEKRRTWPILGDDHALLVSAGRDMDVEPAAGSGLRCVIHCHLNRGEIVGTLLGALSLWRYMNVYVL